jgi:preprotein translocase subunit YajC
MKRWIAVLASWFVAGSQWIAHAQEVSGSGEVGDAGGASSTLGGMTPLLIMLAVFGAIFYFMLIRPQRKRQAKMNELVGSLKRGDHVVTAGGIYGEVDSVGDSAFVLTLEDGAKIRVAKASVTQKRDK